MEIKIEAGGGQKPADSKRMEGSHVRLGWARREAPLNAPAGLDGYSYAMRDKTGEKVHLSRPRPYGRPFSSGDVVGMYISLPPRRKPNPRDSQDPAHIKRERIAIEFKGQEYFESFEYSQSKEMLSLVDANDRGKSSTSTPAPSSSKKSATVKNLPSTSRGTNGLPEQAPLRPLVTLGLESCVAFFVNGESQGIAFQDLYDYIPLRSQGKTQEKKRAHREGLREHKENPFDDGSLGYYPFISLFNEARVRINPGPDFDFPPPPDIDSVLSGVEVDGDVKPSLEEGGRTWRPICERYPEYMGEQFALDEREESGAQKHQQASENKQTSDAAKLEKHREKRRAQAAARKAKQKKDKEEVLDIHSREDKRRKLEEIGAVGDLSQLKPSRLSYVEAMTPDFASMSPALDQAHSPAPTVASSVDVHIPWHGDGHDTSEYNTEYEEFHEHDQEEGEEGGGVPEPEPEPVGATPDHDMDLGIEAELAAAAGVDAFDDL